jgi:uncharacterized glyoxalase superfamily protein PhnB
MKLETIMLFVGNRESHTSARDWYRDRMRLKLIHEETNESVWFETQGSHLGLHVGQPAEPAGQVHLFFEVPDVSSAYDELRAAGVEFAAPPAHQAWGATVARATDPVGHAVLVGQYD